MADPLPDALSLMLLLTAPGQGFGTYFGLISGFVIIILLLLCSAAMSASETGFFSLTPADRAQIQGSKTPEHQRIMQLLSKPQLLLATILISNNLVNVGIVIISTFLMNSHFDFSGNPLLGFLVQVIFITALLLLLGEIMPKVFATRNPIKVAALMSYPLMVVKKLLYPVSYLLVSTTGFIEKRQSFKNHIVSLDDISTAIDITANGKVDDDDRKIMKSITRFGDITAREIMSPRVDVTAVDKNSDYNDVMKIIVGSGYSRIPVYDETPDTIVGILYIKDLLPNLDNDPAFEWIKLIRPPFFVPENKPINDLMQEFRQKKIHMAVVVDEYGGTSGIITLEDIIEEIVGEINDEFDTDTESVNYTRLDEYSYVFEGKTSINDMCRIIDVDDRLFDEAKGESESLAGLMLELSGKMPAAGEIFNIGNFKFRIEAADRRRIKKVKITLPETGNA